ncbi:MAG: hypothetical protein JJU27_14935 [Gammaproteobacteria bacterium]|nr:hypothetical protein [Gammaproteobacteria bacterium]
MRRVGITALLVGIAVAAAFLLLRTALPASGEDYRCAQDWRGPAIITRGGILPLPQGYVLVDRSVSPHWFNNYVDAMGGAPLGVIKAGLAQGYLESQVSDGFVVEEFNWRSATRQLITEPETGLSIDEFIFPDEFVLSFTGAALPFAEAVASCYADLISDNGGEP